MTVSSLPIDPSSRQATSPVAPWWHTILLVAIIVGFSVLEGRPEALARQLSVSSRVPIYAMTLSYELFLFAYIWLLGLRPRGIRVSEIIGGRWTRFRDFLTDLKIAILFWIIVVAVLGVLQYLLRSNGIQAARPLLPQSRAELMMFILLAVTAGFCEEFIFRGYLQTQFLALANSEPIAIVLQAFVFGLHTSTKGGGQFLQLRCMARFSGFSHGSGRACVLA